MRKVYLKCYYNMNLGDDIFIDIITDRYPNIKFIIYGDSNYINKKNVKVYKKNLFRKIVNKILYNISNGRLNYETILSYKCDYNIILGGSMFIEKEINPYEFLNPKKTFILGINFGPYNSIEYKNYCTHYFNKCIDVCFRDKKSFKLFENLKNTRVAPDIAFSYRNIQNTEKNKKVVISLINCRDKFGEKIHKKYVSHIEKIIAYFISNGYKIGLISFCKFENDEEVIKEINKKYNYKLEVFNYKGNLTDAIGYLNNSEIIIGSRFHANILALLLNKKLIPIAYSDKTINELHDLDYKGIIYDIRKIDEWEMYELCSSIDYDTEIIKDKILQSSKHFEVLDKYLEKGE